MSESIIEIFDTTYNLEIETSYSNTVNNLDIDVSTAQSVEISAGYAGVVVYASDIVGLDNYLSNFIDTYEIDCGTP
jgi:hypothetical protein